MRRSRSVKRPKRVSRRRRNTGRTVSRRRNRQSKRISKRINRKSSRNRRKSKRRKSKKQRPTRRRIFQKQISGGGPAQGEAHAHAESARLARIAHMDAAAPAPTPAEQGETELLEEVAKDAQDMMDQFGMVSAPLGGFIFPLSEDLVGYCDMIDATISALETLENEAQPDHEPEPDHEAEPPPPLTRLEKLHIERENARLLVIQQEKLTAIALKFLAIVSSELNYEQILAFFSHQAVIDDIANIVSYVFPAGDTERTALIKFPKIHLEPSVVLKKLMRNWHPDRWQRRGEGLEERTYAEEIFKFVQNNNEGRLTSEHCAKEVDKDTWGWDPSASTRDRVKHMDRSIPTGSKQEPDIWDLWTTRPEPVAPTFCCRRNFAKGKDNSLCVNSYGSRGGVESHHVLCERNAKWQVFMGDTWRKCNTDIKCCNNDVGRAAAGAVAAAKQRGADLHDKQEREVGERQVQYKKQKEAIISDIQGLGKSDKAMPPGTIIIGEDEVRVMITGFKRNLRGANNYNVKIAVNKWSESERWGPTYVYELLNKDWTVVGCYHLYTNHPLNELREQFVQQETEIIARQQKAWSEWSPYSAPE